MIIQIDQLFINTDNIATISAYSTKEEETYNFGIVINAVRYGLFKTENKEEFEEYAKKTISIVNTIINHMTLQPVQRLNLEDKKEDKNA